MIYKNIFDSLNPNFIIPSTHSSVQVSAGGYAKIGNLVIVNLRLHITETLPKNTHIVSLPTIGVSNVAVSIHNNRNLDIILNGNGIVYSTVNEIPTVH